MEQSKTVAMIKLCLIDEEEKVTGEGTPVI